MVHIPFGIYSENPLSDLSLLDLNVVAWQMLVIGLLQRVSLYTFSYSLEEILCHLLNNSLMH